MFVKSKTSKDFWRRVIIDKLVETDFKCAKCEEPFTKGRRRILIIKMVIQEIITLTIIRPNAITVMIRILEKKIGKKLN